MKYSFCIVIAACIALGLPSQENRAVGQEIRLCPPDSLRNTVLYVQRSDTVFVVFYYPNKVIERYQYRDTMSRISSTKWYKFNSDYDSVVYVFRKTSKYNDHLKGYLCEKRKAVSFKEGRKKQRVVYLWKWAFRKDYD